MRSNLEGGYSVLSKKLSIKYSKDKSFYETIRSRSTLAEVRHYRKKRESNWVRDFRQIDEIHLYSPFDLQYSFVVTTEGLFKDLSLEGQIWFQLCLLTKDIVLPLL